MIDQFDMEVEINDLGCDSVDGDSSEIMSIVAPSSFEVFQGNVDHISASRITGWAICTKSLEEKVTVSLWLGDLCVLVCRADRHRVDLELVGAGDGECAFEVDVPEFMHRHFQSEYEVLSLRLNCGEYEFELADDMFLRSSARQALSGESSTMGVASGSVQKYIGDECVRTENAHSSNGFQGNVDGISFERIHGWVINSHSPNIQTKVEVLINGSVIYQLETNISRPDVKEAGIHDGKCGFDINLNLLPVERVELESAELEIWAISDGRRGLMHKGSMPAIFEQWSQECLDLVAIAMRPYCGSFVARTLDSHVLNIDYNFDVGNGIISGLFRTSEDNNYNGAPSALPEISEYTRFTRDRLNHHRIFDYDRDPRVSVDLLIWYLEAYGASRKPLKVPLSKREIAFCNELIIVPGTQFSLTRLHYYFFIRNKPNENLLALLNNEQSYTRELLDWINCTCEELNIVDICVPAEYCNYLRSVGWEWKGRKIPLNRFYVALFQERSEWHCFDVSNEAHRSALYLLALLEGTVHIQYAHLMPDEVKQEFLSDSSFMRQLHEHVLEPYYHVPYNPFGLIEAIESDYLNAGYALRRGEFTSITEAGDRYEFANRIVNIAVDDDEVDIQVIGPFKKASGLGQACRLSANMIEKLGFSYNFVDFDLDNPAPEGFSSNVNCGFIKKSKINLIHLNAESIPFALAYTPDVYSGSYNIGYFFWELDSPALCHKLALEILDEIWVCSDYGVKQYRNSTDMPVVNVGMSVQEVTAVDKSEAKAYLKREFGIKVDTKVFLSTFDAFSFVQRKNPLGVIQAFKRAFRSNENVCLLLKTQNKTFVGDPEQIKIWSAIEYAIGNDARIRLINRTFDYGELLNFKKASDCYISLHKSEGWGFGMIEAMNLEIPVVATNYSGNLEYCEDDNSWLVDATPQYLAESDYIFVSPGQKWVDPDVNHAAELLRYIYENPEESSAKAKIAKSKISDNFSEAVIGARYKERLSKILSSMGDGVTV